MEEGKGEKIKVRILINYQYCDYRLDSEQTLGFHFPVTEYLSFLYPATQKVSGYYVIPSEL